MKTSLIMKTLTVISGLVMFAIIVMNRFQHAGLQTEQMISLALFIVLIVATAIISSVESYEKQR